MKLPHLESVGVLVGGPDDLLGMVAVEKLGLDGDFDWEALHVWPDPFRSISQEGARGRRRAGLDNEVPVLSLLEV